MDPCMGAPPDTPASLSQHRHTDGEEEEAKNGEKG